MPADDTPCMACQHPQHKANECTEPALPGDGDGSCPCAWEAPE